MLTPAHIASSYLLAESTRLFGYAPTGNDVLLIVAAGNILDLDFVIGSFLGKNGEEHHFFPSHTPIFATLIFFPVLFLQTINPFIKPFIFLSLFLHLFLDDIGYWFQKIGLQNISKYHQINWLFPFSRNPKPSNLIRNNKELIANYLENAKANVVLEVLLVTSAVVVFFLLRK